MTTAMATSRARLFNDNPETAYYTKTVMFAKTVTIHEPAPVPDYTYSVPPPPRAVKNPAAASDSALPIPGIYPRNGVSSQQDYPSPAYANPSKQNGSHGSKCICCPYGYHIDLDFVRYCETWQAAASDRIASRGNEEKRRRRARQKECQSMEFLLGLPDFDIETTSKLTNEANVQKNQPAVVPAKKPAPPKPPPKPNPESLKSNKEWQETLSNFEETLSKSFTGPSSSACSTPIDTSYMSSSLLEPRPVPNGTSEAQPRRYQASPPPPPPKPKFYKPSSSRLEPEASEASAPQTVSTQPLASLGSPPPALSSSRLVLQNQQQLQKQQEQQASFGEEAASRVDENRPCLQNIREQMAAALERMKQLEEQVKEIPLLHVQMSVLREERRILLRQLASQKKLNQGQQQGSKRDVGTSCAVVTRDVGVSQQQTKSRETWTNTRPVGLGTSSTETTSIEPEASPARLSKGTQCFAQSQALLLSKSVQCEEALVKPRSSTKSTQSELEEIARSGEAKAVQCSVETRDRGTLSLSSLDDRLEYARAPMVARKNKEVQATESQPWVKLKLSMGVTAKPSVSDASTETIDASISLSALRRQQQLSATKSVGCQINQSPVRSVSRATETQPPRNRDFGTSPQRKMLVDVSVGGSLPSVSQTSTNYCDECKQRRANKALVRTSSSGDMAPPKRKLEGMRTRIPVASGERRLIRQDTWTESLDQLGDGSQSLDKYADRLLVGSQPSDKQRPTDKDVESTAEPGTIGAKERLLGDVKRPADDEIISPDSETDKTKELDDALVSSMVLETPKTPGPRPPMELSREMSAALKVLDDNLRKVSAGGTLPARVKNAHNIVQHEWFKISSTSGADPHTVEFYLDQFEQHSGSLLGHVVNLTDSSGNTAMHYAVSHGNFDVVSILLDSKVCDVNRSNNAGYTPVMLAALAQVRNSTHASVVKRLFQMADVNVRARLHGQTALMLAVSHGRKDMSRLLLDAGAAVNLQDEDGSTALMCAAEHGHADIVRLLLAHPDCDSSILDVDGSSALKIALEAGHADIGVLLYAHQRANRASPMPGQCPAALPIPRPGKRQRTSSSHHHGHHGPQQQYSALSMSAPASPVAANSRKFHSSSLSLVDAPKYSL